MPTFVDVKHKISVLLPKSDLVNHFHSMQSGATLSLPQDIAGLREIETLVGHRQPPRNTYLGTVITKPSNTCFFTGLSWTDHDDNNQSDEEFYLQKFRKTYLK